MKVKSIEHLQELSEVGTDGMGHFEGYIRLNGNINSSKAIYYSDFDDSWAVVNESDDSENEYDSTEEMTFHEDFLVEAIDKGSLWTHGKDQREN
jgi:hypothetical protein